MFTHFFKKRRIRRYARKLPPELKKLYGKKPYYSKGQVDGALARQRLKRRNNDSGSSSISDYCYAYAMYCSPDEFRHIHDEAGESCDYNAMRGEIADTCFGNSSFFTFADMESYSSDTGSSGSNSGSGGGFFSGWGDGDSGGGDSGGDGGGGD